MGVDIAKDVDKMWRDELRKCGKDVREVETRRVGRNGNKHIVRKMPDVRQDCKAAQSRLHQFQRVTGVSRCWDGSNKETEQTKSM